MTMVIFFKRITPMCSNSVKEKTMKYGSLFFLILSSSVSFAMENERAALKRKERAEESNPEVIDAGAAAKKACNASSNLTTLSQAFALIPELSRPGVASQFEHIFREGLSGLPYDNCKILAGVFASAQKMVHERTSNLRMEKCFISTDPDAELLAQLVVSFVKNEHEKLCVLQASDGKEYELSENAARLSGTLACMLDDLQMDQLRIPASQIAPQMRIPLKQIDPQTLPCIVECLKTIANFSSKQTGEELHTAIKPFVEETHLLHLYNAANYLDIPVLLKYLTTYIVSYIVQEKGMKKLSHFLKSCTTILPKNLLDLLVKQLLLARRGKFMNYFIHYTQSDLATLPEKMLAYVSTVPGFPIACVVQSKNRWALPIIDATVAGFTMTDDILACSKLLHVKLNSAACIAIDRNGTRIMYSNHDDASVHLQDLTTSTGPICLSPALNPEPNSMQEYAFTFDNWLRIFVLKNKERQMVIHDPNFKSPIIIPVDGELLAYNGTYALTAETFPEDADVPVVLWHIEDNGAVEWVRNSVLPAVLRAQEPSEDSDAHYLLSPAGSYMVFAAHEPTPSTIFCKLIDVDNKTHHKSSKSHSQESESWNYLPDGDLLACTKSGLIVLKNSNKILFYNTKTKNALCSINPYLIEQDNPDIRKQNVTAFFSDDETKLYLIVNNFPAGSSVPIDLNIQLITYELFGEAATSYTLTQLACLLNRKHISDDPNLKSIFESLPEHLRMDKVEKGTL